MSWTFDPTLFGFKATDDPWIFRHPLQDKPDALIAEKTTVGSWIISRQLVENEFVASEVIYHGNIPNREFLVQLIENTGLIELLFHV